MDKVMVQNIEKILMGNDVCVECSTVIKWSTDHKLETESYMLLCNDCRDSIGNGAKSTVDRS